MFLGEVIGTLGGHPATLYDETYGALFKSLRLHGIEWGAKAGICADHTDTIWADESNTVLFGHIKDISLSLIFFT